MKNDHQIIYLIWKELTNHHLPPHTYHIEYNSYCDTIIIKINICQFPSGNLEAAEADRLRHPQLHIKLTNGDLNFRQQWTNQETTFILADPQLFQNITNHLKNWVKEIYTGIYHHTNQTITYYKQTKYKTDQNQNIIECRKARAYAIATLKKLNK